MDTGQDKLSKYLIVGFSSSFQNSWLYLKTTDMQKNDSSWYETAYSGSVFNLKEFKPGAKCWYEEE